ncbi:hypothetical protein [Flavobacterium sp.]|uniref:hypothetical protein n=1 Tax=Flavobacterium sp. TaxID=239 RepID=UPI00286C3686|nr:hypothetical protein [Flavobacterium sp.]
MKKTMLLMVLFSILCHSQNRTNDELPIISKNNGLLLNAIGWQKNSSGQWINSKNKIPNDLGQNQKLLGDYEKYSVGVDNFKSFEIKNIKIKDSTFILLVKKYKDGFYTYSSIEEGWNNQTSCKYYILSNTEFNKINEIKKDTLNNVFMDVKYQGDIKYINVKSFNDNALTKEILKKN